MTTNPGSPPQPGPKPLPPPFPSPPQLPAGYYLVRVEGNRATDLLLAEQPLDPVTPETDDPRQGVAVSVLASQAQFPTPSARREALNRMGRLLRAAHARPRRG